MSAFLSGSLALNPRVFRADTARTWFQATLMLLLSALVLTCHAAADPDSALVKRGAYLTDAGDCVSCHTAKGGQPFAGGLMMKTPFGEISTPNITPDKETGIGNWTDEQFYKVMHEGVGHEGEYLYPVMPFPWYTTVTRDDVAAIRAYLRSVPAVHKSRLPNDLAFPANIRKALLAWRAVFFDARDFQPDPNHSAQVNRGDYLVNGLAHCGECHNSRPVAGATSSVRQALAGGVVDNWYAPNISSDARDGIGAWSNAQLVRFLKTGVAADKTIAAGPMAQTIHNSLSKLTDDDLMAIAVYLKTTKPQSRPVGKQHALFAGPQARGGGTYLNYCASCHGLDGEGLAGVIPALNDNGIVKSKGPESVINVVLGGLKARESYAPMLAIGAGMSDQDIADVANYVRQHWDNAAPATALPGTVAKLRADTATFMNPLSENDCAPLELGSPARAISEQAGALQKLQSETPDNMPRRVKDLLTEARTHAPNASQADLVNGLTAGYCRVLVTDSQLAPRERALRLGHFSELVYSAASGQKLQ
ncbi:MAG: cytochrome c [Burkholderiaceae bacterium]